MILFVICTVSVVLFMCIPYRYEPQFLRGTAFKTAAPKTPRVIFPPYRSSWVSLKLYCSSCTVRVNLHFKFEIPVWFMVIFFQSLLQIVNTTTSSSSTIVLRIIWWTNSVLQIVNITSNSSTVLLRTIWWTNSYIQIC